jgi:photosystem II stability/assembly factor-like uncharacterized protein
MANTGGKTIRRRGNRGSQTGGIPRMWLIGGGVLALALVVVAFVLLSGDSSAAERPVDSISWEYSPNHLHGISYDPQSGRLFLASHFGLFAREDGQLYQVGDARDDFMGFATHPSDMSRLFVSGHPFGGGNLGVKRSDDGGQTWELLFTGLAGETVDFHSMTISAADPDVLYGWFMGSIYVSTDAGESWTAVNPTGLTESGLCWGAPCLAGGSEDASTLYAGSPEGLLVSRNAGQTWAVVNADVGQMAALTVDAMTPGRMVSFTEVYGLAISTDSGATWQPAGGQPPLESGEFPFAIALDAGDDDHLFIATVQSRVLETTDGGVTWSEIVSP